MSSVRKKMQSIPVIRLDVKMVARQLSLREMDLFQSIQLKELTHQKWVNAKTSPQVAPNLSLYISWFNKTTRSLSFFYDYYFILLSLFFFLLSFSFQQ